jgi:hypothetical protein
VDILGGSESLRVGSLALLRGIFERRSGGMVDAAVSKTVGK